MTIKVRGGATLLLAGLLVSAACTTKGGADALAGDDDTGGAQTSTGGRSGASSRAGASGRAGSGGKAGASSRAGAGAIVDGGAAGSDSAGAGGEAGGHVDPCAACPSDACLSTGECVACTPDNDKCPIGQYCSADDSCVSGCKNDASCASGVCGSGHDCKSCLSDQECSLPDVCGANVCGAACTVDQEGGTVGCSGGLTCCSQHCVDAKSDSQHCGACGTACSAGQFCGVSGCQNSTLAGVCSISKVTVVLDGADGNQSAARQMAAGLVAQCTPAPALREVSQSVPDAVNVTTGQPVAGGDELLVVAGDGYFSHLADYVSVAQVAPIYAVFNPDTLEFHKRANGALVVSNPAGGEHEAQDVFVIQFMRDPSSGTLVLNAYGFWLAGTNAAAYYFVNSMLPSLSTQTKSWYVYQWTDANNDLLPELNEITLIDSGS